MDKATEEYLKQKEQREFEEYLQEKMQRARESLEIVRDPMQLLFRPAFELVADHIRDITPEDLNDLQCRWVDAGNECEWEGALPTYERMVAKVDSPIWKLLGEGAGGHDAMGVPYPPFFENGWKWGWKSVSKKEWEALKQTFPVGG